MRPLVLAFAWLLMVQGPIPVARAEEAVVRHEGPHSWGRWGPDDQRGAANLITPARVAAAAKLIRSGRTYSLAVPIAAAPPRSSAAPRAARHRFALLAHSRPSSLDHPA